MSGLLKFCFLLASFCCIPYTNAQNTLSTINHSDKSKGKNEVSPGLYKFFRKLDSAASALSANEYGKFCDHLLEASSSTENKRDSLNAYIYYLLAKSYTKINVNELAETEYLKALNMASESNKEFQLVLYDSLASVYLQTAKILNAEKVIDKAISLANELNRKTNSLLRKRYSTHFFVGEYKNALKALKSMDKSSFNHADSLWFYQSTIENHLLLKNLDSALNYAKTYDSIINSDTAELMKSLLLREKVLNEQSRSCCLSEISNLLSKVFNDQLRIEASSLLIKNNYQLSKASKVLRNSNRAVLQDAVERKEYSIRILSLIQKKLLDDEIKQNGFEKSRQQRIYLILFIASLATFFTLTTLSLYSNFRAKQKLQSIKYQLDSQKADNGNLNQENNDLKIELKSIQQSLDVELQKQTNNLIKKVRSLQEDRDRKQAVIDRLNKELNFLPQSTPKQSSEGKQVYLIDEKFLTYFKKNLTSTLNNVELEVHKSSEQLYSRIQCERLSGILKDLLKTRVSIASEKNQPGKILILLSEKEGSLYLSINEKTEVDHHEKTLYHHIAAAMEGNVEEIENSDYFFKVIQLVDKLNAENIEWGHLLQGNDYLSAGMGFV